MLTKQATGILQTAAGFCTNPFMCALLKMKMGISWRLLGRGCKDLILYFYSLLLTYCCAIIKAQKDRVLSLTCGARKTKNREWLLPVFYLCWL